MHQNIIHQPELGLWFFKNFLEKKKITAYFLAHNINIHQNRISILVHGRGRFTPKLDVLLCKFYNLPTGYFLKKQLDYDIKSSPKIYKKDLEKIKPIKRK